MITEMQTNGERHSTAEAYAHHAMMSSNTSQGPMCTTPPPHYVAMDTHDISHDVPLNLSLSNSSFSSVSQPLQHRPSVITSVAGPGPGMRLPYTPSHSPGGREGIPGNTSHHIVLYMHQHCGLAVGHLLDDWQVSV